MKKIIFTLLIITAAISAKAQQSAFEKGTNVLSAGIGLGGRFGGYTYSSQTPGISLQYEQGLWNAGNVGVISLGGYLGVKSFKETNYYSNLYYYSHKWNYTIIGVRSAFHYTGLNTDKFDVYGGVMLAYNILSYKFTHNNPGNNSIYQKGNYGSDIGLSLYVGGRYYFNQRIGVFAELGYGVSYLSLGVSARF